MPDLHWPDDSPIITDADFKVIRGAYNEYEEHPERPGWRFTGHYDAEGDPLWHNLEIGDRHPKIRRAEFIGLFDEKARPMYYIKPRFLPEWLQEPITLNRQTWEPRTGWKRIALMILVPILTWGIFYNREWRTKGGFIYYMLTLWWGGLLLVIGCSVVAAHAALTAFGVAGPHSP